MKVSVKLAVAFGLACLGSLSLAAEPTFKVQPGKLAKSDITHAVTRKCEVVVTESCSHQGVDLGTLWMQKGTVSVTSVGKASRAHCIDPGTGGFVGTGNGVEAVTGFVFKSNGTYGFEQVTLTCEKSDDETAQHILTISVERPK